MTKRLLPLALLFGTYAITAQSATIDLTGDWGEWVTETITGVRTGEPERSWTSTKAIHWDPQIAVSAVVRAGHDGVSCGLSYREFTQDTVRGASIQWLETFDGLPQALANCRRKVERKIGLE